MRVARRPPGPPRGDAKDSEVPVLENDLRRAALRDNLGAADVPLDECGACGEGLFIDVPHECPVGGNTVIVTCSDT
jgi:hypothetical protein